MTATANKGVDDDHRSIWRTLSGGAAGVGLVMVALPVFLLVYGVSWLEADRLVTLPLLAIFGIMILFGSLALVAMLFQSLGLTDRKQPLALPEGSIRAAIALALIVLFAIISIMLFQSMPGTPYQVSGLDDAQRNELVGRAMDRVVAVVDAPCAVSTAAGAACPDAARRHTVHLRPGLPSESTDLAKQLLILVGTLMTSVTSYYFAARSGVAGERSKGKPAPSAAEPGAPLLAAAPPVAETPETQVDGCDVAITDITADDELPAARGGVAAPGA